MLHLELKHVRKKNKIIFRDIHVSHEKNLVGWVILGIILPSYIGIIINPYKGPC